MSEYKVTKNQLLEMQNSSYEMQMQLIITNIIKALKETNGNICVSWSGGKDSTLMLYLVARLWVQIYSEQPLKVAFADTTNEHKETYQFITEFVNWLENETKVKIIFYKCRPSDKQNFVSVIKKYGIPLVSKSVAMSVRKLKKYLNEHNIEWLNVKKYSIYGNANCVNKLIKLNLNKTAVLIMTGWVSSKSCFSRKYFLPYKWQPLMEFNGMISEKCCNILKKEPIKEMLKIIDCNSFFVGTMACDSKSREDAYFSTGCNSFENGQGTSRPLAPVIEQTVLRAIHDYKIPQSKYYGDLIFDNCNYKFCNHNRGGCALCGFGITNEPDRFLKLYEEDYAKCRIAFLPISSGGLGFKEACEFLNKNCKCNISIPIIN